MHFRLGAILVDERGYAVGNGYVTARAPPLNIVLREIMRPQDDLGPGLLTTAFIEVLGVSSTVCDISA